MLVKGFVHTIPRSFKLSSTGQCPDKFKNIY